MENEAGLHTCVSEDCYCGATIPVRADKATQCVRRLSGVLQTMVEASFNDNQRAEAFKQLIRREINNTCREIIDEAERQKTLHLTT